MRRFVRDLWRSVRDYGDAPRLEDYAFLSPKRMQSPEGRPLVSIITCVYNAGETLPRAMDSVRAQSWPAIEYVVVDGASTDGSAEIIAANADLVTVLLSEPDEGLYDAFNRGVAVSTGEYVAVLNADDAIAPDHVERSLKAIEAAEADFSFGNVEMIHEEPEGEWIEHRPADRRYAETLTTGTTDLHHATMLVHRRVFERIGLFRTSLRIAADYDWFIRMHNAGFRGAFSGVTSRMKFGGVSTERQELSILEAAYVALQNGGAPLGILRFWGPLFLRRLRWRFVRILRFTKASGT